MIACIANALYLVRYLCVLSLLCHISVLMVVLISSRTSSTLVASPASRVFTLVASPASRVFTLGSLGVSEWYDDGSAGRNKARHQNRKMAQKTKHAQIPNEIQEVSNTIYHNEWTDKNNRKTNHGRVYNSLVDDFSHTSPVSGFAMRCLYSIMFPVTGLSMALMYCCVTLSDKL